jgi:magnesium chelatase subunit I
MRRIGELREKRLPGVPTIEEFMARRFRPAVATCATVSQRLHDLSERVAQASALLSTRVDITRERQNQALLASMDRRAKLQLRLQQTVEGLSVAAICYYVAGLVGYGAKGLKAGGLPLDADLLTGLSIPLVAVAVVLAVRRARQRVKADEAGEHAHCPAAPRAAGPAQQFEVDGMSTAYFPFSAIVGQDEMKLAILCAAVDARIGGVLVFGDRGTGKSTAVRALAALLPKMKAVVGCRYGCDPADKASTCEQCAALKAGGKPKTHLIPVPVVDLPLGATEDRVVGALDLEKALTAGVKAFEPGLLARAHRGFLYIDEVNLLEDHLVDLLIDVAASGENVVEREGLSVRHPARFVLVGSGNPEEGELRPQLLDRFGLAVEVRTPQDIASRVEVVRRRDDFERGAEGFIARWQKEDDKVRARIVAARKRLPDVQVPDSALERAAQLCMALGTDGLRGELTVIRAARALAALDGAKAVGDSQIRRIAQPALRHRLRRDPLDDTDASVRVERVCAEVFGA